MCWALEGVLCWVIGLMSSSGLDLPGDMFTENPHFHNRYLSSVRNVNASSPQNTVKKKKVFTHKKHVLLLMKTGFWMVIYWGHVGPLVYEA